MKRIAIAVCIALSFFAMASARAQETDERSMDFYSYVPALPEIKAPNLDFVPFWTSDLKKAKRAYRDGDYPRALKYFRKESEEGNVVADWYLGHMYRLGRGVDRDEATAFSYYDRVAEQFSPDEDDRKRLRIMLDALVRVADYCRSGGASGAIRQDFSRALRIYKLATSYGHPAAEFGMGVMNIEGQGLNRNPEQGLRWIMKAARKRYAPAEAKLGDLYWRGEVVRPDRIRAVMWYALARETAQQDENPEIFERYDRLVRLATADERIEAEARAAVWAEQYPADKVQY
jgi:TPR repeat protein